MLELEQIKQNLPKLSEKLGEVGDSLRPGRAQRKT